MTIAHQTPLTMGFLRQKYWNELPFPSPEDIPSSGMEPRSPALQADSLPSEPPGKPIFSTYYPQINICLSYAQVVNDLH